MLPYADEDFSFPVVLALRRIGHDVVTAQEDQRTSTPDPDILARAHSLGRDVLTHNRRHFECLHRQGAEDSWILSTTHDSDVKRLAERIESILTSVSASRWYCRVNRPPSQ